MLFMTSDVTMRRWNGLLSWPTSMRLSQLAGLSAKALPSDDLAL
jgi:hypothetical protein